MSQLILDEQLAATELMVPLRRVFKVKRLLELRPGERVLDDRIPEILLSLDRPTFLTIDQGFWDRRLCNSGYCILCFGLRPKQQIAMPGLLRALLRRSEFRTRAGRMGKVARVTRAVIDYWQFQDARLHHLTWKEA